MEPRNKKLVTIILALAILNLLSWASLSYFSYNQNQKWQMLNDKLSKLEDSLLKYEDNQVSQQKFDSLVEKTKESSQQIEGLLKAYAELQNKEPETLKQEIIEQKSQDEILTEAVAKVTPTVVSIVITKDVPKLEVVYVNPFGDDPFFQDFDVRVPRYIQRGTEEKKIGAGTGFIIASNGYIATNRHVVNDRDARYTALLSDGTQKQASIIYIDDKIDFAIIKVDGEKYQYVNIGNSDSLKLGQTVFAVGNALGEYNNSVSTGIISGLNRDIQASGSGGTESLKGVIQTDAAINPGNSGGPLVTLEGEVIGVNVATVVGSSNISFSIPVNKIKNIIDAKIK